MRNFSLLCLVASLLLSCSLVNNHIDEDVLECGPEAEDKGASWVRILSQDGSPLSYEQVQHLDVDFVGKDAAGYMPSLSSKGCIRLSSHSGLLSVRAPNLVQVYSGTIEPQALQTVRLQAYPKMEAQLNCPMSGMFAHKSFPNVWTLRASGNTAATAFAIKAENVTTKTVFSLYTKGRGKPLDDVPSRLSTIDLPEGMYRLEAEYSDPADGWQAPPRLLNRGQECLLTVLHQPPNLPEHTALAKVKTNEIVPWNPQGREDMFSCLEEAGATSNDTSCRAAGACGEPKNFKAGSTYAPSKAGVYRGFYFVQDKAGNRSTEACQTLIVSSEAPHLKVLWDTDKWNRDPSVMDFPSPSARAHIYTQHAVLSEAEVEASLQCKVDFIVQGKALITGENVTCESGRCKDMPMKDFVPCDRVIDLSLTTVWSQWNISSSVMRLHVKADDGAGHVAATMRTIGINESRWQIDEFIYNPGDAMEEPSKIIPLKGGGFLFLGKQNSFARWRDGQWTPIPGLVAVSKYVKAYGTPDGSAWGIWQRAPSDDQEDPGETFVGRLEDDHWIPFVTLKGLFKVFETPGMSTPYLQSATQLVHLRPSGPIVMPLPPGNLEPNISSIEAMLYQRGPLYDRTRDKTYYVTDDQIFVYRGTQWEIVEGYDKPANERYHFALIDTKGRILASLALVGSSTSTQSNKIAVIDPIKKSSRIHQFRKVNGYTPQGDEVYYPNFRLQHASVFSQDSTGTIRAGFAYWDVNRDTWMDGQAENRAFVKDPLFPYSARTSNTTPLWSFYEKDIGPIVHTGKDVFLLPEHVLGRIYINSVDRDLANGDLYWIGKSVQTGKYSVQRIKKRRSYLANFFPSNVSKSFWADMWLSTDGHIRARSTGYENVWKFHNNSWESLPFFVDESVSVTRAVELDNGDVVFVTDGGVRLARGGKQPYVSLSNEKKPLTLSQGIFKDDHGQAWYRNQNSDYGRRILRIQDEKVQNFTLPSEAHTITGLFFVDGLAVVSTRSFEFYGKSARGEDGFVKLDPTRLGLQDFVSHRDPAEELHISQLPAGDLVLQTCNKPSHDPLTNCERTGSSLWRKRDHSIQAFDLPWSQIVFDIDNSFDTTPAGDLVAPGIRGDPKLYKLVNGQWETLVDVRLEQPSLPTDSADSYISYYFFDKDGRIWIAMSDPFNVLVYDP
ncbi:hypothetical protein [Oligoflexus tunisiensis]|uniref:hypothetical protein n=1 Tax=Oligoflexus tunisiensis TaxID=708132 RepID=UPI00114CE365|nr:hypothetical protein [Oligoflexus tunisiensis]